MVRTKVSDYSRLVHCVKPIILHSPSVDSLKSLKKEGDYSSFCTPSLLRNKTKIYSNSHFLRISTTSVEHRFSPPSDSCFDYSFFFTFLPFLNIETINTIRRLNYLGHWQKGDLKNNTFYYIMSYLSIIKRPMYVGLDRSVQIQVKKRERERGIKESVIVSSPLVK